MDGSPVPDLLGVVHRPLLLFLLLDLEEMPGAEKKATMRSSRPYSSSCRQDDQILKAGKYLRQVHRRQHSVYLVTVILKCLAAVRCRCQLCSKTMEVMPCLSLTVPPIWPAQVMLSFYCHFYFLLLCLFKLTHFSKRRNGYTPNVQAAITEMENQLAASPIEDEEPRSATQVVADVLDEKCKKSTLCLLSGTAVEMSFLCCLASDVR